MPEFAEMLCRYHYSVSSQPALTWKLRGGLNGADWRRSSARNLPDRVEFVEHDEKMCEHLVYS